MLLVDDEFCAGKDPKEAIADWCYRDLEGKTVLDIGGGESDRKWSFDNAPSDYLNIDLERCGFGWHQYANGSEKRYDCIIANDLFPNVDQRLEMFLEKFLPRCKKMRLSLTFFDKPKWYRARREEGELLTMLAWNDRQLLQTLCLFPRSVDPQDLTFLLDNTPKSVFPNGRQVLLIELDGKATQATT
jgi:hypothetical protein